MGGLVPAGCEVEAGKKVSAGRCCGREAEELAGGAKDRVRSFQAVWHKKVYIQQPLRSRTSSL